MEYWKTISISALIAFVVMVQTVKADKYEVLYTNSKNITINGQKVYKGLTFDDKSSIVWMSDNQAISVLNLTTKRVQVIPAKRYKEKKAESLIDYIHKIFSYNIKHLSTRDYERAFTFNDTIYYLLDTLRINAGKTYNSNLSNEVIIRMDGETIITPIKKTSNKDEFILTRKIWGTKQPQPVYVDIIETDKQRSWTYFLYKKLYIVPLPLNVD